MQNELTSNIIHTLNQLFDAAEVNTEGFDINNGLGEITIKGILLRMKSSNDSRR